MAKEYLNIAKTSPTKARIEIDGTIGGWDWENWRSKNAGSDIRKQLKDLSALDVTDIEVLITSLGGNMDAALQIHDALKEHPAKVTTIVQGFCASAATVIACAGDERLISPNALYLIHKCRADYYAANENVLEEELANQRVFNEAMLNIYKGVLKEGKSEQDLTDLFEAFHGEGKWITADEAVEFGFATGIQEFASENHTTGMVAAFLNHARTLYPDNNHNIINQPPSEMKNLKEDFAMLSAALNMSAEAEYDEQTGMQLTAEAMQALEGELKAYEELKATAAQTETELSEARQSLEASEAEAAELKATVETLTAERDDYKAKYENAPAAVQTVIGADPKKEPKDVTDNPVYDELEKFLNHKLS